MNGCQQNSIPSQQLTHFSLDAMAAILANNNLNVFSLMKMIRVLIQISLKLVSRSPIDKKPALVQVMAWRIGEKPVSEPMLTQFTNTYVH